MTVMNKLSKTLEMIKIAESNCKTFSMDINDQNAQEMNPEMKQ